MCSCQQQKTVATIWKSQLMLVTDCVAVQIAVKWFFSKETIKLYCQKPLTCCHQCPFSTLTNQLKITENSAAWTTLLPSWGMSVNPASCLHPMQPKSVPWSVPHNCLLPSHTHPSSPPPQPHPTPPAHPPNPPKHVSQCCFSPPSHASQRCSLTLSHNCLPPTLPHLHTNLFSPPPQFPPFPFLTSPPPPHTHTQTPHPTHPHPHLSFLLTDPPTPLPPLPQPTPTSPHPPPPDTPTLHPTSPLHPTAPTPPLHYSKHEPV